MTAQVSDPVRQKLIAELKQLRRWTGLTTSNLSDRPWLVEAIKPGTIQEVFETLVKMISERTTTREHIALANSVNLLTATRIKDSNNLEQRRARILGNPNYKEMFGSSRTLIRYEDAAFEELADGIIQRGLVSDATKVPTSTSMPSTTKKDARAVLTDLLNDVAQLQRKIAQALVDLEH